MKREKGWKGDMRVTMAFTDGVFFSFFFSLFLFLFFVHLPTVPRVRGNYRYNSRPESNPALSSTIKNCDLTIIQYPQTFANHLLSSLFNKLKIFIFIFIFIVVVMIYYLPRLPLFLQTHLLIIIIVIIILQILFPLLPLPKPTTKI